MVILGTGADRMDAFAIAPLDSAMTMAIAPRRIMVPPSGGRCMRFQRVDGNVRFPPIADILPAARMVLTSDNPDVEFAHVFGLSERSRRFLPPDCPREP